MNIVPETPFHAPRDGEDHYTVGEDRFVRVTAVTGQITGQHLLAWYSKMGSQKAASWLVQGGLFPEDVDVDEDLYRFTEEQAYLQIEKDEAIRRALDWKSNMKEPERFRDERARVGQLGHLWHHHFAIGQAPSHHALLDWLTEKALGGSFLPSDMVERQEALGVGREKVAHDHAMQAVDRIRMLQKWFEDYRPEYHAVGMEAVVINEDEGYAGTCDGWARFQRRFWSQHRDWPWPGREHCDVLIDLKFTKAMPHMVLPQMCAYRGCPTLLETGEMIVTDLRKQDFEWPTQGAACLHIRPDAPVNFKVWDNEGFALDDCYDACFLSLLDIYKWFQEKPSPVRTRLRRAARKQKKTEARTLPV